MGGKEKQNSWSLILTPPTHISSSPITHSSPHAPPSPFSHAHAPPRAPHVLRSPTEMFLNLLDMESIVLKEATILDANHLLVVYKQNQGHIERRIVQGPAVFVPTAEEW